MCPLRQHRVSEDLHGSAAGAIFLGARCAKNATDSPSGDQNGFAAPSVSASGMAASESSGRIHNRRVLSAAAATNTRRRPSGEML